MNYGQQEGRERLVSEITGNGGKAVRMHANLAKEADVRRLFAETKQAFGRLDILVNNAGIYDFQPLEKVTAGALSQAVRSQCPGLLFASQETLKYFGSEGGNIINISSVAATSAPPGASVYSATKAAVNAVTRSLAQELGSRKIRVNAINPEWSDRRSEDGRPS